MKALSQTQASHLDVTKPLMLTLLLGDVLYTLCFCFLFGSFTAVQYHAISLMSFSTLVWAVSCDTDVLIMCPHQVSVQNAVYFLCCLF